MVDSLPLYRCTVCGNLLWTREGWCEGCWKYELHIPDDIWRKERYFPRLRDEEQHLLIPFLKKTTGESR